MRMCKQTWELSAVQLYGVLADFLLKCSPPFRPFVLCHNQSCSYQISVKKIRPSSQALLERACSVFGGIFLWMSLSTNGLLRTHVYCCGDRIIPKNIATIIFYRQNFDKNPFRIPWCKVTYATLVINDIL